MILYFDTETTGLDRGTNPGDFNFPHVVELAWAWCDFAGNIIRTQQMIIDPGVPVPEEAANVHGLSTELLQQIGCAPKLSTKIFFGAAANASIICAHNIHFDLRIMKGAAHRAGIADTELVESFYKLPQVDTNSRRLLKLPGGRNDKIKLSEAHEAISKIPYTAHQALDDVIAGTRLLRHAISIGTLKPEQLIRPQQQELMLT